jgi:hypothetical protein
LLAAMTTIETLLCGAGGEHNAPKPQHYNLRSPRPGDFGWIVKRHGELYAQEYQWKGPFEGLCAQITADFVNKFDSKRERCWIAEMNGENVGCVMLAKDSPANASPSPAARVTKKSRYGPTACSPGRVTSMRKPGLS